MNVPGSEGGDGGGGGGAKDKGDLPGVQVSLAWSAKGLK